MNLQPIPSGIGRVLTVSAHPDDSEFFAGGTLGLLAAAGAEVTLVVCTDGGRGGRDITGIPSTRAAEQDEAARVLGIREVIRLNHPDGDLEPSDALRDQLILAIRKSRAELVLGHDPRTFFTRYGHRVQMGHSDHRAAGTALMDAIYPRSASPNFLPGAGEPWSPRELWLFDTAQPDHVVDIGDGMESKLSALRAHGSQQGAGGGLVKAALRAGALLGNEEQPAEGFVRLTLRG